ncbi:Retrotransposon nucleocapsid protein [Phytophthora megakarya]|uniref:Retrotransposon nucleocapsid protein n=1 Tax=Phytophthora megakarya TaxID=4795 RepID=A0A225VE43_9STRA|nr:Retrotransposon nucleocapsid protein [Phytophthora megakarya]
MALPETKVGYDAVMVVIDRLTKQSHFLPTTTIATALETATLYRDRVFSRHGLHEELLSDRDSRFTSAYTPEINYSIPATGKWCQTIENYLWALSNINSDDWDELLALAEFAYNSRYQAFIAVSPFETDLGYFPITPATLKTLEQSSDKAVRNLWNDRGICWQRQDEQFKPLKIERAISMTRTGLYNSLNL